MLTLKKNVTARMKIMSMPRHLKYTKYNKGESKINGRRTLNPAKTQREDAKTLR